MGLSLKIERVDEVERVKARLQQLTQKRHAAESIIESKSTAPFEQKLDKAEADYEMVKEERKNRKKLKKQLTKSAEDNSEELGEESNEDEDLMTLMGFKSFS